VLLQEDKFKMYKNELEFVLREHDRIFSKIRPNTKSLLVPHQEDLEYKLRPGMVTLTWTSMNIDGYLAHVHSGLAKLEQLIININDIMENRIENNLKALSKTVLVNLPQDARTFTLEEFVEMQEEWIKDESEKLKSKNQEVEGAVEDLIQMICSYQLDQHVEPISAEEIQKLSKYYNWSMYQALLHATKYSLNLMKERICGRRNAPKQVLKPFFEVEVRLEGSLPELKPSMNEVQMAINSAARHVLKSTKNVQNWCQKNRPEAERDPFYTWIAKDKEIVKVILLLTGSIRGTENAIEKFLEEFQRYEWLFTERIDDRIRKFNQINPQLEDFEAELLKFSAFEEEIDAIAPNKQIGALNLQTLHVKGALKERITLWKTSFAKDLHKKASAKIEDLKDDMKQIRLKIEKPAADVDSLGNVMHALEDIRTRESQMDIDFRPVLEMYRLLDIYIPEIMAADETDPSAIIEKQWKQLVADAGEVRDELMTRQASFKRELIRGIQNLTQDVKEFRENFDLNGPAVPGIAPREALNRLRMFSDEYSIRKRRYDSYHAGELLFGLPNKEYPELTTTEQQLALLQQLYSLYQKVNDTIARWKEFPWTSMSEEYKGMEEAIEQFISDCGRLPKPLRKWEAYQELKTELENMESVLPLVNALAAPAIRPRHWEEIIELTGTQIPYADDAFSLQNFLDAPILDVQEDVEVIADNAEKQLKLERDLNGEIGAYWEKEELTIQPWKGVDAPCTIGGNVMEINEMLDDHLMKLNQMAAMRYVTPFKAEVQAKSGELALVQETLDKWIKIQALWVNLMPVFTSGDIAMSLPAAAKKFKVIDKQWLKLMERAHEQKNVIRCCKDDILQQSLPQLGEDLNFCERQLADFLEDKRGKFPRFYFVASTDLLTILSVGSDPTQLQDDFEKMFDAIKRVSFDGEDKFLITEISYLLAGVEENIPLQEPVRGEGNIEDYLQRLEKEMMRSVKVVCHSGSQDIVTTKSIPDYCRGYQSQVALLGIQMIWNHKMTECLEKPQKEKVAEFAKKLREVREINFQLSDMCLDGTMDRIQRTKIETCVTINVRQQEITTMLVDLVKRHAIKDPNDFEWQRNSRAYWNPDAGDVQIAVTDVVFTYQYEFLGAKERLCITPLTDKCYVTLAQALGMNYGGAPAGPAGTGKTETVKDLSCTLATYIVVTNCAPEHKFKDMASIFKGLSMSGAWGCFDEFNRITLPTLSVVAAQVASVNNAKRLGQDKFMFPGETKPIKLVRTCGYFITMNPGYAGRQELPENLKVLFRGVCMMIPDRRVIIKVKLASQGFKENDMLSLKFHVLYALCEQQLTKTRHYDFGLRNILSVLRGSGSALRKQLQKTGTASEQKIMATTLRDMNLAKFIAQDVPLFLSLIDDIFPKCSKSLEAADWRELEVEIVKYLKEMNLSAKEVEPGKPNPWYTKVI
jgi:dynein heavy chain, axonemal